MSVKIPLSRFGSSQEDLHQLGATAYDAEQGLASAVRSLLKHLKAGDSSISNPAKAGIAQHVVGMIEQMLRDQSPAHREPVENSAEELVERSVTYIESNLQNPDLNPQLIANSVFISTRYLHQLFAQVGMSPAKYVHKRRLERIRADLASPFYAGQPIEQVILRGGVQNVSYFGQVFKKAEGCTPAEFRRKALRS